MHSFDADSIEPSARPIEFLEREFALEEGRGVEVADPREFKMEAAERLWWEGVRRRGAMWFVVNKGLAFFLLYPSLGHFAMGWEWQPTLMVEGWALGLACGSFVWMRKELRYRFTLDEEGLVIPDGQDE